MSETAFSKKAVLRVNALIASGETVSASGREDRVEDGLYSAWTTQSFIALEAILGKQHPYYTAFAKNTLTAYPEKKHVRAGLALLRAILHDLDNGFMSAIENLISAEIFSDFLEMAEHLQNNGYKDPTASLCGAVLEDSLRKIARNAGIAVSSNDNLQTLNGKCADGKVYNSIVRKQVQVWIDLRNKADHGEFAEYSNDQVQEMLRGVRMFLATHLS